MSHLPRFNYIITIHNKEDLIKEVLTSILICCRENSCIYPVLDGCTDSTEAIVDYLIKTFSHIPITKVHTPDVHEIRAINAGLRAANQDDFGYNIILQDDVLLRDFKLQEKVTQLYEWAVPNLGFVSFRHGANLTVDAAISDSVQPFIDYVENAYGHGLPSATVLLPGQLAYRAIAIKSPVCIPTRLIQTVGLLDERLAPYMCDDIDYSIRCTQAGYQNAVFALRFQSDVEWGTTRTNPDSRLSILERRNIDLIRQWHASEIANIATSQQNSTLIEVPNMRNLDENASALEALQRSREHLESFFRERQDTKLLSRFKSKLKNTLKRVVPT